ncbi:MAG TPA: glycosyltransferase family 4 protein [Jiangellaceae bacterium]|nr:glycosyltransferase family 4 protein [Jiangellaceae bacterium]
MPAVLRSADLLVMPSKYEELGTAMLEAMQVGVPVVAADTGGIPDVICHERNGLLVPSGDPAALAGAISRLLADPSLASTLAGAAKAEVGRYDWNVLAQRVFDIYSEVLEGHSMMEWLKL